MSGAFWGAADDAESIRVIHRALDLGVPLIDTAEAYGGAPPRRCKALTGRRQRAVIATRAAPNHLEPAEAVKALEGSLKRLQTDYVDVYFIHWPNSDVPVGATMEALERCARKDASGRSAYRISAQRRWTSRASMASSTCCSRPTTWLWREVEATTLPYCREHNIGVMPYSGLAQGLLTGALSRNTTFVEWDERRTAVLFQPGTFERALDAVEGLRPIAAKYGKSVAQLAIQWLTSRPGVSSPLLGARAAPEIEENAGSVGWTIAAAHVAEIDRLTLPVWKEIADKGDMFGYWAKQCAAKAKA
jgi:myo-inositol catabolism protein IolS